MISYSTMLSTLLPFSARTQQRWRNSNSGLRASPKRTLDFRSHPTPKPTRVICGKARELTKRAVDSAIRADSKENGRNLAGECCSAEAVFGNPAEARQSAAEALKLAPTSQGVEVEAALAFAMAGDTARAESLAQDLGKRFPLDTQMQSLWLPAIQAQLALDKKNPAAAVTALQAASPIEFGQHQLRRQYFLPLSDVRSRRGILGSRTGQCCRCRVSEDSRPQRHRLELLDGSIGASGSGSCECVASRETTQGADADAARVRALAAYKDFLTLWKDADPDIPILKQAKAEYAKLQ